MDTCFVSAILIAALLQSFVLEINSLISVEVQAKLPQTLGHALASYDGDEIVYIFGGYCEACGPEYVSSAIYGYNITSDTIVQVGMLPKGLNYGTVLHSVENENYFIFGGYDAYQESHSVFRFNATSRITSEVAFLPRSVIQPASFLHGNVAYVLGGGYIPTSIMPFDLEQLSFLEEIPFPVEVDQVVAFFNDETATFLGSRRPEAGLEQHVVTFSPDNQNAIVHSLMNFTKISYPSRGVSAGRYGYVIGGPERPSATDAILQYDQELGVVRELTVENYVGADEREFWGAAVAYVERLNRIYIFGGVSYKETSQFHDQIWYIDLSPLV